MPFRTIPGLDVEYGLISFDKNGRERTDDPEGGLFTRRILDPIKTDPPTDVFLFIHGWKGDERGAMDQYNAWIGAMAKLDQDRKDMGRGFRPMFLGLHWPSQPWGEEDIPPASFDTRGEPVIDELIHAAVDHFDGGDAVKGPITTIFRAFEQDPAATELPDEVVQAYRDLARAIGFSAGSGPDAPPDEEGAPLDPQKAVKAERMAGAGASFGILSKIRNGILAGLRQASFWLMKHRARTVGEQGMHTFVRDLQNCCGVRVHLMGHSFGCIVVSGILGGPSANNFLPKPVSSAVLVQGALSLWSYSDTIPYSSKPGYFRKVLSRVSGPIVTTQSVHDLAVGFAYPAAVGLVDEADFAAAAASPQFPIFGGVGTFGIQGTAALEAEPTMMLDENGTYNFEGGRVYNLDSSRYIPSHTGIDGPQVAHAIWQAALVK